MHIKLQGGSAGVCSCTLLCLCYLCSVSLQQVSQWVVGDGTLHESKSTLIRCNQIYFETLGRLTTQYLIFPDENSALFL